MNLILLGYGRMGKAVEAEALAKGHSIALALDTPDYAQLDAFTNQPGVVAIDFSVPDQAVPNAMACLARKIPLVVGTTGWQREYPAVAEAFRTQGGALLVASNFSPGVNFMLGLARQMAAFAERFPAFVPHLSEVHHTRKLDAPSGTAVSLADAYLSGSKKLTGWKGEAHAYGRYQGCPPYLPIEALREEEVFGIHTLTMASDLEEISLRHEAKDRSVFAAGAVAAAEWMVGRRGVFTMQDVLGL